MKATVRLQRERFDAAAVTAELTRGRTDVGAVVTFAGILQGRRARRADRGSHARVLSRHGGSRDRTACQGSGHPLAAVRASQLFIDMDASYPRREDIVLRRDGVVPS